MIRHYLLYSLIVLGDIIGSAKASNEQVRIRSVFDINYAFCDIKTNGVTGLTNRYSALAGRGFGSSSTNAMLLLENGENEISLEIGALGWFSEDPTLTDIQRRQFNPQSGCKLELTEIKGNQFTTLSRIEVAIDKEGLPFAREKTAPDLADVGYIKHEKVLAEQVEEGHFDSEYFLPNYFPANMEVYRFTQKVHITGLPQWIWINATPVTGTVDEIKLLQDAYSEIWQALNERNASQLKTMLRESLQAWAFSTGDTPDEIYDSLSHNEKMERDSFRMIPIDWNHYELRIMNRGRMVRLVNKSVPTFSPLSYYYNNDEGEDRIGTYVPMFSLIDGKFILVL